MGATPKPPGQRRRRNAGQSQWRQLPAAGRAGDAPGPKTNIGLGELAMAFWDTIWRSPMAVAYTDADVFPLTRLAVLVDTRDRYERAQIDSFDGDAEMRQLEDRYGISPLARRRL